MLEREKVCVENWEADSLCRTCNGINKVYLAQLRKHQTALTIETTPLRLFLVNSRRKITMIHSVEILRHLSAL